MELAIIVIIVVAVAMYYGLGENLEVSSGMLTRELREAERDQKARIIKKRAGKADKVSDEEFKAAAAEIKRIDALEI